MEGVIVVYRSIQAFCSSITGTLATQAMLKGYGVGDEKATALAATMTWILRSEFLSWAIATTLCEELQASNYVYKSRGAPARGIGPPPVQLEKLLTSIASRLTLPKLHWATFKTWDFRNLVHYIWYNVLLSIEVLMTNKSLNEIQLLVFYILIINM